MHFLSFVNWILTFLPRATYLDHNIHLLFYSNNSHSINDFVRIAMATSKTGGSSGTHRDSHSKRLRITLLKVKW